MRNMLLTILIPALILFVVTYNKSDSDILRYINKSSYTLLFLIGVPMIIIILASLSYIYHLVWCGVIIIFLIPKFINIVSKNYRCIRIFSLLLEFTSAYFLSLNIVPNINTKTKINTISKSSITFVSISFAAMVFIEIIIFINDKRGNKNMNIKQEINQLKKVSKDSLNNEVDDLVSQLNDMNDSNKLNKNSLKNFKDLINNNDTIKSHVESIVTKISMKILGLK